MSNRIKKLREVAEEFKYKKEMALYTTLIGTLVCSIGILLEKTEKEQLELLDYMSKNPEEIGDTVEKIAEYVWNFWEGANKKLRANLVLITDIDNVRSPMVGITVEDKLVPLDKRGIFWGIMGCANEGRDNVSVEYIYTEEGELYNDDTEQE